MVEIEPDGFRRVILDKARGGHNLAILGGAGTGKTFLVQTIVKNLEKEGKVVQITATTGAACECYELSDAITLDSFCGISPGRSAESIVRKLIDDQNRRDKINSADVLIVDEISMCSALHLELFEHVLRSVRGEDAPFGGIQVIVIGDFKQIEPVRSEDDPAVCAFNSSVWKAAFPHVFLLTKNFRQMGHQTYSEVLRHIADGAVNETDLDYLRSLCRPFEDHDQTESTHLYYRRQDVRYHNTVVLEGLPGATFVKRAKMNILCKRKLFFKHCSIPELLELKVGARVMLLVNLDGTHHNGSQATVDGFSDDGDPVLNFSRANTTVVLHKKTLQVRSGSKRFLGTITQYPIDLAYAITVHKSQGKTLTNKVIAHLGGEFARGQVYVALSRSPDPNNLSIVGLAQARFLSPTDDVIQFYREAATGCFDDDNTSCCRFAKIPEASSAQEPSHAAHHEILNYLDGVVPSAPDKEHETPVPSAQDADLEREVNLDILLNALEEDECHLANLPDDFCVGQFLNSLRIPETEQVEENVMSVNNVYSYLMESQVRTKAYFQLKWREVYGMLKIVAEDLTAHKYTSVQFCQLFGSLNDLLTQSEENDHIFANLLGTDDLQAHHTAALTEILFQINAGVIHSLAARIRGRDASTDEASVSDLTEDEEGQGKIRYIGGWTIHKVWKKTRRDLDRMLTSVRKDMAKCKHVKNKLCVIERELMMRTPENVADPTQNVTVSRQSRGGQLVFITDATFAFFRDLECQRGKHLNEAKLNMLKGSVIDEALYAIKRNAALKSKWISLFTPEASSNDVEEIYEEVLALFITKVGSRQFINKINRDMNLQKKASLRQRVLQRTAKANVLQRKIALDKIDADRSPNKKDSHTLITAMLIQCPDIFSSRAYSVKELKRLCSGYSINPIPRKKSEIAGLLSRTVLLAKDMCNSREFELANARRWSVDAAVDAPLRMTFRVIR